MSLISYASPWTNDENNNTPKKRIPTMRKTMKMRAPMLDSGGEPEEYSVSEPSVKQLPPKVEDVQSYNEERGNRVHELLNKITLVGAENDGAHLANFSPLPPPESNIRRFNGAQDESNSRNVSPNELLPSNPLQHPPTIQRPGLGNYGADDRTLGKLTNYLQGYSINKRNHIMLKWELAMEMVMIN